MTWLEQIAPRFHRYWAGATGTGWIEPPRRIFDHELVLVTRGQCDILLDGREQSLKAPAFIVIPPNHLHATFQRNRHLFRICIHFDWIPGPQPVPEGICVFHPARISPERIHPAPAFVPRRILQGSLSDLATISNLAATLLERQKSTNPTLHLTCNALLLEILYRVLGESDSPPSLPRPAPAARLAHEVRLLLQKQTDQNKSVQTTLESLGFSYAHLCRLFRRHYGITPVDYLNALRIEQAKTLLSDEGLSMVDVARRVGFNHAHYFSRMFRRQTGQNPSDYREQKTNARSIRKHAGPQDPRQTSFAHARRRVSGSSPTE